MSVIRQKNWLGQQRVDVPHLREIESSIVDDFDVLAGQILAGRNAMVVTGFDIIITGAIGNPAVQLQMNVAGGLLLHPTASENGTIFNVPLDRPVEVLSITNNRILGSFTAGAVNYVGLDLKRTTDNSTADIVEFLDANSLLEVPKTVALARTLDYVIVISTTDFASTPGIAPVAIVTTDVNNNVTVIQDAHAKMFRLGSGGSVPNRFNAYAWPAGRKEDVVTNVFDGGDKTIASLKEWCDAIMTRLWEQGGGEYWYSPTADRNVTLIRTGPVFVNGEYFEWDGTNLHWKGLKFIFDNSTGYYNDIKDQTTNSPGLTNLADGECIYVDLDRTQNLGPASPPYVVGLQVAKAVTATLGTSAVPGSRQVIAWRVGADIYTKNGFFAVNTTFLPATTTSNGLVTLSKAAAVPGAPVVLTATERNSITGSFGVVGLDGTFKAMALGMTRDGTGQGAGDINIGGGVDDNNIYLNTGINYVRVNGKGILTNIVSPFSGTVLKLDGTTKVQIISTVVQMDEVATPAAPPAASGNFYFKSNGLASPNYRTQFVVQWADGSETIVAESPAS